MLVKHVHATFAQGRMSVTSAMQAVREAVTQAWDNRACRAAADTGLLPADVVMLQSDAHVSFGYTT